MAGDVQVTKAGSQSWSSAQTNEVLLTGDRLRTGEPGKAMLRLADDCLVRVPANTIFEIEDHAAPRAPGLFLQGGSAYLNSRERPGRIPARTRLAAGAIRGTEFHTASGGFRRWLGLVTVPDSKQRQRAFTRRRASCEQLQSRQEQ